MKGNFLKTFLLLVAGMMIGAIIFITSIIILIISFSDNSVVVKNNSWIILNYSGEISEKPVSKIPSFLGGNHKKIELYNYLNAIESASFDEKISGIIINGDLAFYSKEHVEEIRNTIIKFRKSGKKVIAWFSEANNQNYYLCLAADAIYMPDTNSSNLTLSGYSMQVPYYKKGLDKLGLQFDVVHVGDFKGTGENLVRDTMSDEMKESYYSILDSIYNQEIKEICNTRKIKVEVLQSLIESGKTIFMNPNEAKKAGLIDDKKNYKDLFEELRVEDNAISIYDYSTYIAKKVNTIKHYNKIAILYPEGTITNYYNSSNSFNGDMAGAKSFIDDLRKIKKDKSVKLAIIRVNSPGGSALGSELILQEILKLKKVKPVYVSMGPLAASGGYYISCAADKIFTSPYTITGSIGVVSLTVNFKNLSDKLGVNFETLKKHEYDDFLSTTREHSKEELDILYKSMMNIYSEFSAHVIEERKIAKSDMPKIAEGRVWTGTQAINNKLADEIGGLLDTIDYAVKANKLDRFSIESYPKPPDFFDKLAEMNEVKISIDKFMGAKVKKLLELYNFCQTNGNYPCTLLPYIELP